MVEGLPVLWFWQWDLSTYLWILGFLIVYFLPGLLAIILRNKDWGGMVLFNFLMGWTIVGWFLVLNWVIGG